MFNDSKEQDFQKKFYLQLLKSGSKYEKLMQQFCLDMSDLNLEDFYTILSEMKKEALKYFKDKSGDFDDDKKKVLDVLAKFVNEENFGSIQISFYEVL